MSQHDPTASNPPAAPSIEDLQRLARSELSPASRLGYVALLLFAAMMTTVAVALLLGEPDLPLRTRAAFLVISAIGASWVVFAVWVLRRRRAMLAPHHVVAGRMAVAFTSLFVAGAAIAFGTSVSAATFGALVTGLAMFGIALWALLSAQRRFARLTELRDTLERELDVSGRPAGAPASNSVR